MTLAMASLNRSLVAAGDSRISSSVNGFAESEVDAPSTSERAFLIGVAGGTASGKVLVFDVRSTRMKKHRGHSYGVWHHLALA